MFKQAVEENIGNHILAADTDMDLETYEKLRSRSVHSGRQSRPHIGEIHTFHFGVANEEDL